MKAILQTKYGPPEVLELKEVEKPTPTENQVLVKVHAASVNALEWRPFTMSPIFIRLIGGLVKPRDPKLGTDVAGQVEAVGSNVTEFQPGDEVFGVASGAFAEYVCAGKTKLALKPTNVSFEAAAAVPLAAFTALQGLRVRGQIRPRQKVLINGAAGGVGIFAVQLAKSFGAEVTAVCSTRNLDLARSVGADHVIDYTLEDFTKSGQHYDLILAVNGYHPLLDYRRSLGPDGICVVLGGSMAQVLQGLLLGPLVSRVGRKKMGSLLAHSNQEDLIFLRELLEAGKVVPVIDRSYPLSEVPEALRYLMEEHARGKVIITAEHNNK